MLAVIFKHIFGYCISATNKSSCVRTENYFYDWTHIVLTQKPESEFLSLILCMCDCVCKNSDASEICDGADCRMTGKEHRKRGRRRVWHAVWQSAALLSPLSSFLSVCLYLPLIFAFTCTHKRRFRVWHIRKEADYDDDDDSFSFLEKNNKV